MNLAPAAERRARLNSRFAPWRPMTVAQALDGAVAEGPDRPLVITARGVGGVAATLLGSVAAELTVTATRPVVVLSEAAAGATP